MDEYDVTSSVQDRTASDTGAFQIHENSDSESDNSENASGDTDVAPIARQREDEDSLILANMCAEELLSHTISLAPVEGNQAHSLMLFDHVEELCFPAIYGGHPRLFSNEYNRRMSYTHVARWELRSVDQQCAKDVGNLFFKLYYQQYRQVHNMANFAMRRGSLENQMPQLTARHMLD